MGSHEHCRNCFISRCTQTCDCPIVPCELKCGMVMHHCKMLDHRFVCQSQQISCINSHYGCPAKILRSRLSSHLSKCPANVIICTMEWGRYPVYSVERLRWVPFLQPNPVLVKGYLDVELAVRDQRMINMFRVEKCGQGASKRQSERFDLKMKLSYERATNIHKEILYQKGRSLMDGIDDILTPMKQFHGVSELHGKDDKEMVVDVHVESIKESEHIPECPKLLETHSGLGVNINLETIPKFVKHKFMYRVPCSQLLHRHEFAGHFKNVHSDIHGGMGWLEQRCPFSQYGCSFVRYRLCPSSQEGSIVFSQDQGTFGIRPLKNSVDVTQHGYLLWLPCELLEVICKWLDSYSLRNLSQTCKTLRESLLVLLPKRGIVVLKWKKRIYEDGSSSWTVCNKCWSFTSAFSEVRHWVHSETPIMSSHMEKCPYNLQHKPEKSFRYVDF